MSDATNLAAVAQNAAQDAAAAPVAGEAPIAGLLDQAIKATKQTAENEATKLLRAFTEEALKGTLIYKKNLFQTINQAISDIDAKISNQLNAVMHHPKFQKLEGTWRGLRYLVMNTETGTNLKLKVAHLKKEELYRDLSNATEFDQSELFKKIYESEFGISGGVPYGALIGDYEFSNDPQDIETLRLTSQVAAAAFAPFIGAADPQLLGMDSFAELPVRRDLAKTFDTLPYTKWKSYRESEDSRFVTLVLPRVLARLPYGRLTSRIDDFAYEEAPIVHGIPRKMAIGEYCWMNAAYVMGARLTDAFAQTAWCTAIRGAENGGKVENLPFHTFKSDDGDDDATCPTEVGITDRREKELSDLGFLPLVHYKNTDYSVFFGAQTTQKPKQYDRPAATANAEISARLPYIMASSRIAHYLKCFARDKIGSFREAEQLQAELQRWIERYTNAAPNPSDEMKARNPLREAQIQVQPIPGKPGSYNAVAYMRPWLQLEELTTSLRMVAEMPPLRN